MNTAETIIAKFGTQQKLAEALGIRQSNVSYWVKAGSIPAKWHLRLLALAQEKGIVLSPADFLSDPIILESEVVVEEESEASKKSTKERPRLFATHSGFLDIAGKKIPCAVLNNRKRVLIQREVVGLLTGTVKGDLNRYLRAENLQPYVPQKFRDKGLNESSLFFFNISNDAHGFEATDLIDFCDMYLKAMIDGVLHKNQIQLAKQATIIIKAFAKVGIIAAIDEATGYKKQQDEYQKLLSLYIAEELQPWIRTFGEDYYYHIYRLKGWNWERHLIEKKNYPWMVANITNRMVYEKLPDGVLAELNRKNPKNANGNRRYKKFQFLTPNIGYVHLLKHLGHIQGILEKYQTGEWQKALHEIDTRFPSVRDPYGNAFLPFK
jgi:hypothetical protein